MARQKTSVYLPHELKAALERAAAITGRSEAELIREGIRYVTAEHSAPEPRLPAFASGQPDLARHVDDALAGFGER
jgi:Ribbon-helix-helix protein, copG family